MTMKQAAGWSILWVTLSLLFNAAFWWYLVQTQGRAVADPQALAFPHRLSDSKSAGGR